MDWIKITCPYCRQRIPISSMQCPECHAVIPHECGEVERRKILHLTLALLSFLLFSIAAGLFYWIFQLLGVW